MKITEYKKGKTICRDMTAEEILEMKKSEQEYLQSINYDEAVDSEIRKKYSVSEEFAILRQRDSKQEEYSAYYAYCEECKAYVKKMIAESNSKVEIPDSGDVQPMNIAETTTLTGEIGAQYSDDETAVDETAITESEE